MTNLMNFKLILDQADMELKIAARAQNSESDNYKEAKERYRRAARRYITEMNVFCENQGLPVQFDSAYYFDNKYDN